MAIDKQAILKDNQDLRQRMSKEAWKVTYDKKSDTLIFGSKFPKNSGNIYINEREGSMVRIGEDNKIYGFVFENYKSVFLKKANDSFVFWFLFLYYTNKFLFIVLMPALTLMFIPYYLYNRTTEIKEKYLENYTNNLMVREGVCA